MNIDSIQTYRPQQSFGAQLKLHKAEQWNATLASAITSHPKIQRIAAESPTDIIAYQSVQLAKTSTINHSIGDELYQISLSKERQHPIAKFFMNTLGLGKIKLARSHRSEQSMLHEVLPSVSYRRLKQNI